MSSYSDKDPVKRRKCQVYGGKDYNHKFVFFYICYQVAGRGEVII